MRLMDLVTPRHVGSSRTRGRTGFPCIGRRIPNHSTAREVPSLPSKVLLSGQPSLAALIPCQQQMPPLGSHPPRTSDVGWSVDWTGLRNGVPLWVPPLTSWESSGKSLTSLSGLSLLTCRMGIIIETLQIKGGGYCCSHSCSHHPQ